MKTQNRSEKRIFAVTGASGNVGSVVARKLTELGHDVRPVSRRAGVPFEDETALARAFHGVDGVFLMLPTEPQADDLRRRQNALGDMALRALRGSAARRLVFLSSLNAEHPAGTGPILGLRDLERRLETVDLPEIVVLRPGFFMENHLRGIATIRQAGVYGTAFAPNEPLPMIAARDVGAAAAEALCETPFSGNRIRELLGPRDYTMTEAARALGAAIGRPVLPYVAFPYDEAKTGLLRSGASPSYADAILELARGFNERRIHGRGVRTPESTTPTRLETFATEVFRKAFDAAEAA